VAFVAQSLKTEIITKTISPTWDQTLIFDSVEIHGNPSEIAINPPQVVIEVFDYDPNVINFILSKILKRINNILEHKIYIFLVF
jgi:hypothetical protein